MNWQPIASAPTDRPIVVTDGVIYGLAYQDSYTEPEMLGYDNRPLLPNTLRPNPDAGKIRYYWAAITGWTSWALDVEWEDGEYEQSGPRIIEPTHWSESPPTPESQNG